MCVIYIYVYIMCVYIIDFMLIFIVVYIKHCEMHENEMIKSTKYRNI